MHEVTLCRRIGWLLLHTIYLLYMFCNNFIFNSVLCCVLVYMHYEYSIEHPSATTEQITNYVTLKSSFSVFYYNCYLKGLELVTANGIYHQQFSEPVIFFF